MLRFVRSFAVLLALLVLAAPRGAGATAATDLCPPAADPCVITADVNVAPNSTLDFGSRAVDLKPGASLSVTNGSITILAGSLRLEPNATLDASAAGGAVFKINVTTTGSIRVEANATQKAKMDVSGGSQGGEINLAAAGDIQIDGNLFAKGTFATGTGGSIHLSGVCADGAFAGRPCDGDVPGCGSIVDHGSCHSGNHAITGAINASGNDAGGIVNVFAPTGSITVGGSGINASGGVDGGGDVDVEAGDTLTTSGPVNVNGGGLDGDAGSVTLIAGGAVVVGGAVSGQASGSAAQDDGGTGADVEVTSFGASVRINATIDADSGADGSGGDIELNAGTDILQAPTALLSAAGRGTDGDGGYVTPTAGGNLMIGPADVSGGTGGGGQVDAAAGGVTVIQGEIDGDGGAELDFQSGGSITVNGHVHADGDATTGGGRVSLQGCDITIGVGQTVSSSGPAGQNDFQSSGHLLVLGSLVSASNTFEYLDGANLPTITGSVVPPAVLTQRPDLPPCAVQPAICGNGVPEAGEECDDGNVTACDGCSPTCHVEQCGNDTIDCGEQCDDGAANGTSGSACSATCTLVGGIRFLPGSHSGTSGCFLEWQVNNPNSPVVNGFPATTQHCIDGDPACDADGASDGTCTFQAGVCVNRDDSRLPACAPHAISRMTFLSPPPLNPSDATDSANTAQLYLAGKSIATSIYAGTTALFYAPPNPTRNNCSSLMPIRVPLVGGQAAARSFRADATDDAGHHMGANRMILACDPNPAVCGNGVVELGEECDDGNTNACDGCSPSCKRECGNGVVECAEQCDDGAANGTPGDACSARCLETPPALRVPGGGTKTTDCGVEWSAVLATPAVTKYGIPKNKQYCIDNDPTCDFDPTPGTCRLHVWACLGGGDTRLACSASAITGVALLRPTLKEPPINLTARTAMLAQLGIVGAPTGPGEQCTGRVDVDVPVGRKLFVFKTLATGIGKSGDRDSFSLGCKLPPVP